MFAGGVALISKFRGDGDHHRGGTSIAASSASRQRFLVFFAETRTPDAGGGALNKLDIQHQTIGLLVAARFCQVRFPATAAARVCGGRPPRWQ